MIPPSNPYKSYNAVTNHCQSIYTVDSIQYTMGLPVYEQYSSTSTTPSTSNQIQVPPEINYLRTLSLESTVSTYSQYDHELEPSTHSMQHNDDNFNNNDPTDYLQRRISTDPSTGERIDYALDDTGELRTRNTQAYHNNMNHINNHTQLNEIQIMHANDAVQQLLAHTTLLLDRQQHINNINHMITLRNNNIRSPPAQRTNIGTTTQQQHHIGYIPSIPYTSNPHTLLQSVLQDIMNDNSTTADDIESYDVESSVMVEPYTVHNTTTFTPNNTQSLGASTGDLASESASNRVHSSTNESPLYWNNSTSRTQSTNTNIVQS